MHFQKVFIGIIMLICSLLIITACSSGGDKVVVEDSRWLKDGEMVFWPLSAGTYKVQLTASGDGASIEWVGSSCPKISETNNISTICELAQSGQVIVSNPTTFGLGNPISVSVKITKN